jgi:hypothetical protein
MKPLKFPGDPDPAQNITVCPDCNGAISEKTGVPFCHNCNKIVDGKKGNPYQRKTPDKGERYKDFGPRDTFVNPTVPFNRAAQSKDHLKRNKKDEDLAEHNKDTVKEVFVSDEFEACIDPKRKNRKFDDKEGVMRSCTELAIDG